MLDTLAAKQPALAILENVVGIMRFIPRIERVIKKRLPGYYMWWTRVCPTQLGHAVRRPRVYFILCRVDLCVVKDHSKLAGLQETVFRALESSLKAPLQQRLLPRQDKRVQSFLKQRKQKRVLGPQTKHVNCSHLKSYQLTKKQHSSFMSARMTCRGPNLVADVSQSAGRVPFASHGLCPTLTPGGHCVVADADRCIIPEEKLLLGGIPLHKLHLPKDLTSSQLASLGGNLMHVEAVAACTLMGLAVLKPKAIQLSQSKSMPSRPLRPRLQKSSVVHKKMDASKSCKKKVLQTGLKKPCYAKFPGQKKFRLENVYGKH